MNLNKKIVAKLDELNLYVDELETLLPQDVEEYLENLKVRRACEKTIELAIEVVISILSSIVNDKRLGVPFSEENIIEIAQKNHIISVSLAKKIKEMKGFRNILVHKYGEVDDGQAYHYLSEELGDFESFEREINRFLAGEDK